MRVFLALAVALVGCGGAFSAAEVVGQGEDSGRDVVGFAVEAAVDAGGSVDKDAGFGHPNDAGTDGAADAQLAPAEAAADGPPTQEAASEAGCATGATRCVGTSVETCQNGEWQPSVVCPYVCNEAAGVAACAGECVPGTAVCNGQQPEVCGSDGAMQAPLACAESSSVCRDGACQPCSCGAGVSCFYNVSPPPSGYGATYPVTVLFITPSKPSVTVTAEVTSLPQPDHNAVWFDIDLAAFPSGGTLSISGATGAYGCAVSSYLADQCARYPASGDAVLLDNVSNVQPGEFWAFPVYHFAAGTNVLHFGTEGNWAGSPGTVNINTVTITVQ